MDMFHVEHCIVTVNLASPWQGMSRKKVAHRAHCRCSPLLQVAEEPPHPTLSLRHSPWPPPYTKGGGRGKQQPLPERADRKGAEKSCTCAVRRARRRRAHPRDQVNAEARGRWQAAKRSKWRCCGVRHIRYAPMRGSSTRDLSPICLGEGDECQGRGRHEEEALSD
jgi:hypothetical protein